MVIRMVITLDLKRNHLGRKVLRRRIFRGRISSFISNIRIPKIKTKVSKTMVKGFQSKEVTKIH